MKWLAFLVLVAVVAVALWKYGYVEEFLGPWWAWAKWIGYFTGEPGVR